MAQHVPNRQGNFQSFNPVASIKFRSIWHNISIFQRHG